MSDRSLNPKDWEQPVHGMVRLSDAKRLYDVLAQVSIEVAIDRYVGEFDIDEHLARGGKVDEKGRPIFRTPIVPITRDRLE